MSNFSDEFYEVKDFLDKAINKILEFEDKYEDKVKSDVINLSGGDFGEYVYDRVYDLVDEMIEAYNGDKEAAAALALTALDNVKDKVWEDWLDDTGLEEDEERYFITPKGWKSLGATIVRLPSGNIGIVNDGQFVAEYLPDETLYRVLCDGQWMEYGTGLEEEEEDKEIPYLTPEEWKSQGATLVKLPTGNIGIINDEELVAEYFCDGTLYRTLVDAGWMERVRR